MHQARIIDPQRDIFVLDDEDEPSEFHSIVIFLDDFSHLRPDDREDNADDDAPKIVQLYSETDDEAEDSPDGDKDKDEEEDVRPDKWYCVNPNCPFGPAFENDIENGSCCICEAQRPPMDDIISAHKAKLKADKAAEKAAAAMEAGSEDEAEDGEEPLHHLRLKMLKRDLRHIISHQQRIIAL